MANKLGIRAEVCNSQRIAELDSAIKMDVKGGIWFEQDCHLDPNRLMEMMLHILIDHHCSDDYGHENNSVKAEFDFIY